MKHNFFIGLGGSGGKIVTELYKRLITEKGKGFESDVACIAIDTDQDELNYLSELGVSKICLSGDGTVGDYYNNVGGDIDTWFPNTANEGNFFSSSLFGGASQCRFKSRLCLANFLKDANNELLKILEESLMLDPTATGSEDKPPVVLIASSIAGGTGSGIFIQVALYIKKFFRDRGIDAIVHGLFACPDLYKNVVTAQMLPNLYANAYAVVRELNAFNLICGAETTTAYGGKLDLDVEICTDCEGKLFKKNPEGRYGDKPYDILYFIDKLNYLNKIIGGLPEYYKAMANIAYSHLYTDISGEVWSNESNEMHAHSMAPNAIYGSAGAASMTYPHDDIVNYFASRALKDSLDSVWNAIDIEWKNYCTEKDISAKASGLEGYKPEPGERADHYIKNFDSKINVTGITKNEFYFLSKMVNRDNKNVADILVDKIESLAAAEIEGDERITTAKNELIGDTNWKKNRILDDISQSSNKDEEHNYFIDVEEIDEKLDDYCEKGLTFAIDQSITFANKIICDDYLMWNFYDKSNVGIVSGLLIDDNTHEWIHPVAARYLLYIFKKKIDERATDIIDSINNTPADDADDFLNHLNSQIVVKIKANDSERDKSNKSILESRLDKMFGGKKAATKSVNEYFAALDKRLILTKESFVDALIYFSFIKVSDRLEKLISEYEAFFDKLDEFSKKAEGASSNAEKMHETARGNVYVCASADIKRKMFDDCGSLIGLKTGKTASSISKALFEAMRIRATGAAKKLCPDGKLIGLDGIYQNISSIVAESIKENNAIESKINMNVIQAILYEYALTNPQNANDEATYSKDDAAKNRLDQFIGGKFKTLVQMAAPMLSYDVKDDYCGMFEKKDKDGRIVLKPEVNNFYRYISYNPSSGAQLNSLTNSSEFFNRISSMLPKDTQNQTVSLNCVNSNDVDPYTILCYSTVHCLQPYQINAFDEINGGVYYTHYAKRIADMEALQRYSMSPHLDKRWHKHGMMPYINVKKELERRLDLAKAFLFALTYGKIGYDMDGTDARIVFGDNMRNHEYKLIIYKGKTVPYFKLNRVINWFADQEALIADYAAQFDAKVGIEIEKLSKYSENVRDYDAGITNNAKILDQLKKNILRNIEIDGAKDGKQKKVKIKSPLSLIEFAWNVHTSEESENDKDYGELLIETLCAVISRYARDPYNSDAIDKKDGGSEAYNNYLYVSKHIATKFMESFVESLAKKQRQQAKADASMESIAGFAENVIEEEEISKATGDLVEGNVAATGDEIFTFSTTDAVRNDKSFQWALALFNKYLG